MQAELDPIAAHFDYLFPTQHPIRRAQVNVSRFMGKQLAQDLLPRCRRHTLEVFNKGF
jgi:hypothetical protein